MFETIQYDLTRISYGRRGTFYYVGAWEEDGAETLYVCALLSGLDNAGPAGKPRAGRLFPVRLVRNGETVPYRATATPVCVTLAYDGGTARICLQEGSILRMEECGGCVFSRACSARNCQNPQRRKLGSDHEPGAEAAVLSGHRGNGRFHRL